MGTDAIHTMAFLLSTPLAMGVGLAGGLYAAKAGRWWPLAIAMPLCFVLYPALVALLGG